MRRLPPLLLLVLCLAAPAWAEEPAPAPEPREAWVYERDGTVQRLDVTGLAPGVREAVDASLRQAGWTRTGREPGAASAVAGPAAAGLSPAVRRDLEALVRGRGSLPPGYAPRAFAREGAAPGPSAGAGPGRVARFAGRVLQAWLAAQAEPERAQTLRPLVEALAAGLAAGEAERPEALADRLAPVFATGLADPARAPAWRALLEDLGRALGGTDVPGPAAPPADALPADLGGAVLTTQAPPGAGATWDVRVRRVDEGSAAWAAGLRPGDRLLDLDGRPVTPEGLRRASRVFARGGQLRLRVQRRNGSIEHWLIELEVEGADAETHR